MSHACLRVLVDSPEFVDPCHTRHAEQVEVSRALLNILTDMCVTTGVRKHDDLSSDNLNERTVSKEKLCKRLDAFAVMMNKFAKPHLQIEVHVEQFVNSYAELLTERKNVIDLQTKLIEQRDKDLTSVKATVESEVKLVQSVV